MFLIMPIPLLIASLLLVVSTQGSVKAEALDQKTIASKGTGKIVGRVRVEGRFERPEPLKVYKNREFCGTEIPEQSFLVGASGGVQNAVITIRGGRGDGTRKLSNTAGTAVLDNKNCVFAPHVQVVPVGSEVLLINSDAILHDVHARLGSETLFNIGLPSWRQVKKRFTQPGVVAIQCEVLHTWMSAYIVVTSSPHFAVTDEKGNFSIDGVPAGNYELEVWHEKLGRLSTKVVILEGRSSRVDLVFPCVSC